MTVKPNHWQKDQSKINVMYCLNCSVYQWFYHKNSQFSGFFSCFPLFSILIVRNCFVFVPMKINRKKIASSIFYCRKKNIQRKFQVQRAILIYIFHIELILLLFQVVCMHGYLRSFKSSQLNVSALCFWPLSGKNYYYYCFNKNSVFMCSFWYYTMQNAHMIFILSHSLPLSTAQMVPITFCLCSTKV